MLALHFFRQIELFPPSRYFGVGCVIMWCDPICFSYLFLIFMGLKWFTTSWNQKYSPQMLWEHHFRPIKMDHSQLYRRETITINISERMSEDMPDRMSEDMPDRIPEDMPDRMSEDMPDRMSDRMLEDLADRIPDRMTTRLRLMSPLVVVDWCWLWLLGMRLATFIRVPRMQRV